MTSTTYDELPYDGTAFWQLHPDRMAVLARLHGLTPAPVERCRVLELGCARGANLAPMAAYLPHSSFLGVDLSARQIAEGLGTVEALGLANLQLQVGDILDFDPAGPFDYIICHGVYSWVPPAVQDRILRICRDRLADHGVALVSYNIYPGWHLRSAVRDILAWGARGKSQPREQVEGGMGFLQFLARCVEDPDCPYGRQVRRQAEDLSREGETYVFHEYLEECNTPVYFEEFARRASAAGLQYLDDSGFGQGLWQAGDEAQGVLAGLAHDPIRFEQCLDFLRGRSFRQSLLCRTEAPVRHPFLTRALRELHLVSSCHPSSSVPDLKEGAAESFTAAQGQKLSTGNAFLKAAMVALHQAAPRPLAFGALWDEVRSRLGAAGELVPLHADADVERLAPPLLSCARAGAVDLHSFCPALAAVAPPRPLAWPLTRWQAQQGRLVVDPYHRTVELDEVSAAILPLLDGTRDRSQLADAVERLLGEGKFSLPADRAATPARADIERMIEEVLGGLARVSLLARAPGRPRGINAELIK